MNPLQLMQIHVATLYRCDPDGRLRSVNEPGDEYDPPRFAMGRTPQGNLCRFRHDLPDDLVGALTFLCASEPVVKSLEPRPWIYDAVHTLLQRHAPVEGEYRGPAYWMPGEIAAPPEAVQITNENAELLRAGFPAKLPRPHTYDSGPLVAAIADGQAVAICYCSRLSEEAAEAGVDTLEAYRGQGHASSAVAGWAVAVRERGLLPMYSTTWNNLASRGVARRLGMVQYGEDWAID